VNFEFFAAVLARPAGGTGGRPGFDGWVHGCAPGRSALFYASMHPGSRETVAIGITCLNYVGLLKPASLMARVSTTRVGQTIAYSSA